MSYDPFASSSSGEERDGGGRSEERSASHTPSVHPALPFLTSKAMTSPPQAGATSPFGTGSSKIISDELDPSLVYDWTAVGMLNVAALPYTV